MKRALQSIWQFGLLTFLVLTLVGAGVFHTGARSSVPSELAAYVAAGGALTDICGDMPEGDESGQFRCETCRLIGVALVPSALYSAALVCGVRTLRLQHVATQIHYAKPLDPSRLSRAPPQA